MLGPVYQQSDFAKALLNLLPRGRVWPRDADSVMSAFWMAMAGTPKRNSDAALGLLNDSPPFSLAQMLPEWEATLGLPDLCAPANQSVQQRVQAVIAKLSATGGQTTAYFLSIAAALGYEGVTITEDAPGRCGITTCGEPCNGLVGWYFVWTVNAPSLAVIFAQCGLAHCGDPLYGLQDNELECTLNHYTPAHTLVLYTGHA